MSEKKFFNFETFLNYWIKNMSTVFQILKRIQIDLSLRNRTTINRFIQTRKQCTSFHIHRRLPPATSNFHKFVPTPIHTSNALLTPNIHTVISSRSLKLFCPQYKDVSSSYDMKSFCYFCKTFKKMKIRDFSIVGHSQKWKSWHGKKIQATLERLWMDPYSSSFCYLMWMVWFMLLHLSIWSWRRTIFANIENFSGIHWHTFGFSVYASSFSLSFIWNCQTS